MNFSLQMKVDGGDVVAGLAQQGWLLPHAGSYGDVLAVEGGADGEDDEGRLVVTGGVAGADRDELLLPGLGLPGVTDGGEPEDVGLTTLQGPGHIPLAHS